MKFFTRKQKETKQRAEAQSPLTKKKISIIPITVLLSMLFTNTVLATTGGDFSSINTGLYNLGDIIKGFGLPICTIAVIVGGIMLMAGQRARENAKYVILSAGGGLLIVNFAEPIANMINSIR